jgi:hypothetical protein
MTTASEYKAWLDNNKNQQGTELFGKVERAYELQLADEQDLAQQEKVAPDLGFFGNIRESITGEQRTTPETQVLPEWTTMPELNQLSVASAKTGLGTLLSNPKETVQIIQANFPGVAARTDDKGNFILRSSIDKKEYVIPPGFSVGDVPRAAGALTAFTPAGAARTIPGMMASAGLTQTAIEGTQQYAGGTTDLDEIAMAAGTAPILPVAAAATKSVVAPAKDFLYKLIGKTKPTTTSGNPAMADALSPDELAEVAKKASAGGVGAESKIRLLAEEAAPDAATLASAERLGISQYLQPDHLTTNQAYIELAQAVKSVPGSQARALEVEGLREIGQRATSLVDELGGSFDLSMLDTAVKGRLEAITTRLERVSDRLYGEVRKGMPGGVTTMPDRVLSFIEARAVELGGERFLSSMEKTILRRLRPTTGKVTVGGNTFDEDIFPTYALLDDTRKLVGAAARQQGIFKDADTGLAKLLYGLIEEDQLTVAAANGLDGTLKAAQKAIRLRKGVEDDMMSLFGKKLASSLVNPLVSGVKALQTGDVSKLKKVLEALPKSMRPKAMASGLTVSFGQANKNGLLNFKTYTDWYEGLLRNKEARELVMDNLPDAARQQLWDLYKVSKGVMSAQREAITTGRINAVKDQLNGADSLIANIFQVGKRSAVGIPVEAATTSMGFPGVGLASGITAAISNRKKPDVLKAADSLITSSAFMRFLQKTGTAEQVDAARKLANSTVFRRFAKELKGPRDPAFWERWIINSTQTGRQFGEAVTPDVEERELPEPPAPQSRARPVAPPTRGVPGLTDQAPMAAAPHAPAGPPGQSRQMLASLFPFDPTLQMAGQQAQPPA